jgi:hypothetical protein
VDPQSGVAFPVVLAPAGGGPPHQLAGTATRTRTIFRVTVYAYGLYVERDEARKHLASFSGRPAPDLARDPALYRRLLEMRIPMTLRLVMTRNVGGDSMIDAFDEALRPRVTRAAKELNMADGAAALERFSAYFSGSELARGAEIVFSCGPVGQVSISVGGQPRPRIDSPALCWALFDVYLGDAAISADGRRSLIEDLPALLTSLR